MEWNGKQNGKKLSPRSGMETKQNGNGMEWKVEWKNFARRKWIGKELEWIMEWLMGRRQG